MRKDPTEFRKRFAKWKEGGKPYKDGKISDELYVSIMEKVAADNWLQWGDESEDAALTRILNDNIYDYRGYYNDNPESAANADTHWPDKYKTVWHPTFSNHSKYSGKKSQYNPYGYPGGTWQGELFNPQWYLLNPHGPGFYKDGYPKLPRFAMGTEGDDIEELIKKRLEQRSDNTSVQRLKPVLPIKRNFIAEAQRKHAAEVVGPDTRSSYQRKQSQAAKLYANQQYLKAKDDAKRAEGMELLMKTISPSTYVEAATGLDLGTVGRLATDAAVFGLPGLAKRGIKSIGNLAKIGKLDRHNYHVSTELTNEPVNIPFEKYKKEAIQGSLELLFGKNVADKVNRFYQKDVYPRFINQTYTDFATDEVRDLLGYNGLPKGIKLYGYHDPNSIAFGFSDDGNIYMNYAKLGDELRLFESIIHESEHAQRQLINNSTLFLKPWYKSGYIHVPQNATDEQKIFAKSFPFRGYIDSELQRLLYNYPLPSLVKGVNINPLKEAGASNRELRAAISEDYGGRLGVDLDATIDNMSNKELERYINGLNGYTDWIYNNHSINFDGIKNTLKKVPAIAAPITILNKYAE